jgi:iron complex outermembrane receptor protein
MLGTAVGISFAEERLSELPDGPQRQGDTVGFNNSSPLNGTRRYDSLFAEFKVPLASPDMDVPAAHSLDTGVAVRYDHYSDFGGTWNPKVWLRWQPINETVTLRGSYSTSFRPPTFGDLYTLAQESYPELLNPARSDIVAVSDPTSASYDPTSPDFEAGWDATLYPAFEQIKTIYSGNPDLEPETSDNFTAGLVYTPDYLKNLSVSVDWFKIDQDNIPGSVDQYILDQNYNGADPTLSARNKPTDPNAPFASNIVYDPNTTAYLTLYAPTFNLSRRIIEGLDFRVRYEIPTENIGAFTLGVDVTHYYRFEQENQPGEGFQNRLGVYVDPSQGFGLGSLPRWKGNFNAFWNYADLELGAILYWVGSYDDDPQAADRQVDDWLTLDLQASYNLPRDVRLTVGVQNVTDEPPPLVVGAFADNYDRDTHTLLGRFVYGQVSVKF